MALERLRGKSAISPSASSSCRRSSRCPNFSTFTSWCSNASSTSATSASGCSRWTFSIETDEVQQDVAHRAARLYRFDERKYRRLAKAGFNFEKLHESNGP